MPRYRDAYNDIDRVINLCHQLDAGVLPVSLLNITNCKDSIDKAFSKMTPEDARKTKRCYRKQKRRMIKKHKLSYESIMTNASIYSQAFIIRRMVYTMLFKDVYDIMWWY